MADLRKQIDMNETTSPPQEPDRVCTVCSVSKPAVEFHRMGVGRRRAKCGQCYAATRPDRHQARWPQRTPKQKRDRKLRQLYGITPEQYATMLAAQGGQCAMCRKEPVTGRPLAVDHCHESGVVRALLCTPCNTRLGVYENFRERASLYLTEYGQGNPLLL